MERDLHRRESDAERGPTFAPVRYYNERRRSRSLTWESFAAAASEHNIIFTSISQRTKPSGFLRSGYMHLIGTKIVAIGSVRKLDCRRVRKFASVQVRMQSRSSHTIINRYASSYRQIELTDKLRADSDLIYASEKLKAKSDSNKLQIIHNI
jgi:hypothetical protein